MSLKNDILNYMKQFKGEVQLSEIYKHFDGTAKSTIRGRVNESIYANKIINVSKGKGRYLLVGAKIEAIIEQRDSKEVLFEIIKSNIYYDLIFLDIPYATSGQAGGNRCLNPYSTINPEEFQEIIIEAEKTLRTENSQVYFMMSSGKSSAPIANKYIRAFENTSLNLAATGSYTKTNKDGGICNIGKYQLPAENVFIYSPDGKLAKPEETILDFTLQRPPLARAGGYPTQKNLDLILQIVRQSTNPKDKVLDLFGGSGVLLEACMQLNRFIHMFEISSDAISGHILKRAKAMLDLLTPLSANNNAYKNKYRQLTMF